MPPLSYWQHQWVRLTSRLLGVVAPTRCGGMKWYRWALTAATAIQRQPGLTKQNIVSRHISIPTDNGPIVPSAIARSPCRNQSSLTLQQILPLPSQSVAMFHPYPHLMPPIEEGERCHICDQPAWGLTKHIAWCRECSLALLPARNVFALMIVPKCTVTTHAHLHANRWIRILLRFIAYVHL